MGSACSRPAGAWRSEPPEGYSPVVAFKLCPPGGVYVELAFWLLDYANDAAQLAAFVGSRDWWFATLVGGSICFSSLMTYIDFVDRKTTVLQAARDTVTRGVAVEAWDRLLAFERGIEAPISGFVAPYGMALNGQLTPLQACSAALGVLLSAKAMAAQAVRVETARRPDAAAIHAPRRVAALRAWRLAGVVAELSSCAIACRVLHPAVAAPGYLLGAMANAYAIPGGELTDRMRIALASVVAPVSGMFGMSVPVVGLPCSDESFRPGSGAPIALVTLLRLAAWAGLCWTAHWRAGLVAGFGTLGRPMGRQVLQFAFLRPGAATAEAAVACAGSAYAFLTTRGEDDLTCELPATESMSSGAAVFHAILLALCLFSLPIYVMGLLLNLAFNGRFRRGEVDDDLTTAVKATHARIQAWGDEQQAGYATLTAGEE